MQPISAPFGETWTVLRGSHDRTGDKQAPAAVATIEGCVYWQNAPTEPTGGYPETARESSALSATLAVPKGTGIRPATDQLRREATGQKYRVVGPPQWDQVHPMTGWDPGYETYQVRAVVN